MTTTTAGGVRLLGFIDRIDAAPDGDCGSSSLARPGKGPRTALRGRSTYQMRLRPVWARTRRCWPDAAGLLRAGQVITFDPVADDMFGCAERHIDDLWTRDWAPEASPRSCCAQESAVIAALAVSGV